MTGRGNQIKNGGTRVAMQVSPVKKKVKVVDNNRTGRRLGEVRTGRGGA